MDEVILINPPQPSSLDDHLDPPLPLMYIAANLEKNNINTRIVDLSGQQEDRWGKMIGNAGVFGMTIFSSSYNISKRIAEIAKRQNPKSLMVVGGPHPTALPIETSSDFDTVVVGEGEEVMVDIAKEYLSWGKVSKIVRAKKIENLDGLPMPARHLINLTEYHRSVEGQKATSLTTSRGCYFSCFTGDTIVNTIEGNIPIKDLVGKKNIKLFTFDRKTEQVFITDAINCRKTRKNADIVRVLFDDGTHIDCTPDHRFLVFKNGNQFIEVKRWEVEAKDLKPKMSVHALRFYEMGGYTEVVWGRRKKKKLHRMIYEHYNNEEITDKYQIHQIDKNRRNNNIKNLLKVDKHDHIRLFHPEVSERMKKNNPTKNMTPKWRENIRKSNTGKERTIKQRINYRNSKLGEKNPMYKHGKRTNTKSRLEHINHKIISVTPIGKADVYDLEVPATHWFFANNVLVHNCNFCCRDVHGSKVRFHSVDRVIDEVKNIKNYGINSLLFYDDVFTLNKKGRLEEICKRLKPLNITFRCNGRVGVNKPEDYKILKEAGCDELAFGIESGAQKILDVVGKRVTVKQNEDAIKYAKQAGLNTKAYLMVGFPGETQETVDETKRFIERADPDKFTLFAFVPLPGCDVYKNPQKYGITNLSKDWNQYFNIAGQYEGGVTFETKDLPKKKFIRLHDDLRDFLLERGQRGELEKYYSKVHGKNT